MPAFLVKLDPTKGGRTLRNGADAMVVFAADADQAKQMADAAIDGDGTSWLSNSTATEIVVGSSWEGWKFQVDVLGGFGTDGSEPASVTVLGSSTNDTIDEIGTALAAALNALDGIAGATYTSATNVLTIAAGTDALGDQTVVVSIVPPAGYSSVSSLVGTVAHEGGAGDPLSVTLPADNAVVPAVAAFVRQAD